ncbi:MopE-related protein [Myxococcota bacterium]
MPRILTLFMFAAVCGCGGLAYLSDECLGPYCHIGCETDADCPDPAWCQLGQCTTGPEFRIQGQSDGSVAGGDWGPTDGVATGGDSLGGDLTAKGDASRSGDPIPGEARVNLGDGNGCWDLDLDGYCPCCALGDDCDDDDANAYPGAVEICDGIDNNCNGHTDEGVLNACGNCEEQPECNTDDPWHGGSGADTGDLSTPTGSMDGTILDDQDGDGYGSVTLVSGTVATDVAWPASEKEGTISRIDTVENREVGRYPVVLLRDEDFQRPYVSDFGPATQCQQASRSTIDEHGNAYIANRANSHEGYSGNCANADSPPSYYGSITKIGYFHEIFCDPTVNPGLQGCACIDRNGNGRIDTSRDYNDAPNGIQVPVCTGGDCDSPCVEDYDCPANRYCVRELHPSQAHGQCSTTAPPIAPCTGALCAQSCARHADCPVGNTCVRDNTNPTQRFCSNQPETPEFLGKDDECVLWTVRIPGYESTGDMRANGTDRRSKPRAMAIDNEGYIWVGDHEKHRVFKLSPTGEFVDPIADATPVNEVCPRRAYRVSNNTVVNNPQTTCLTERCFWTIPASCRIHVDLGPYGAVIDGGKLHPNAFRYLWVTNTNGNIQRIDTETGAKTVVYDTEGSYGISIDHRDRVWLADQGTDSAPNLHRFDPGHPDFDANNASCAGCWNKFVVANPSSSPWNAHDNWRGRGITTELLEDGTSRVWAIFNNGWWSAANYLVAVDTDTGQELTELRARMDNALYDPLDGPGCIGPSGVGVGYGGKIWMVFRATSSICAFDPNDLTAPLVSIPIGPNPYTYSDFTGNIFNTITNPQGYYRLLVRGCPHCYRVLDWGVVNWDADVPGSSMLEVRFRTGSTPVEAANPARPQYPPASEPAITQPPDTLHELPMTNGEWLQVEFKFIADDAGLSPSLHHVDVARECQYICE